MPNNEMLNWLSGYLTPALEKGLLFDFLFSDDAIGPVVPMFSLTLTAEMPENLSEKQIKDFKSKLAYNVKPALIEFLVKKVYESEPFQKFSEWQPGMSISKIDDRSIEIPVDSKYKLFIVCSLTFKTKVCN